MALAKFIAIAVMLLGVTALSVTPGLAAKGGKGRSPDPAPTTSSIVLNEADPHFGGTVTFTVTYPDMKYTPFVSVLCSQNGEIVYQYAQWSEADGPWVPSLTLWDAIWAANGGGSANCVADLYYYIWKGQTETALVHLAHTEFVAAG